MRDGHLGKCKRCTARDVRKNRLKNIDKIRKYDRDRGYRQAPEYQRECRRKNKEKVAAQRKVAYEVKKGRLTMKPCETCEELPTHAHHDDYSRQLDIRWLCPVHHKREHPAPGKA